MLACELTLPLEGSKLPAEHNTALSTPWGWGQWAQLREHKQTNPTQLDSTLLAQLNSTQLNPTQPNPTQQLMCANPKNTQAGSHV